VPKKEAQNAVSMSTFDRCDPHPGAIGGLLQLHTTRKVVVSYEFAHIYIYIWGRRELTSIAASSKEVLERAHARPTAQTAPGARL
jgi:hypothetical protein